MATKIQQIMKLVPQNAVLFSPWLTAQGMDTKSQNAYKTTGWLYRISKGVYCLRGATPTLMDAVASYNHQLNKNCIIGAYTALDFRGYSHYLSIGKPKAYLFTDSKNRIPSWLLNGDWNMTIKHTTTSFLGNTYIGVETMVVEGNELPVSSPERAILECLYLPEAASTLLDIYYIMESLTTLRPKLVQQLLERCTSQKVKRLFLYMSEKANHPWYKALQLEKISFGTSRYMVTQTGKYIKKYNMTIPKELADYE